MEMGDRGNRSRGETWGGMSKKQLGFFPAEKEGGRNRGREGLSYEDSWLVRTSISMGKNFVQSIVKKPVVDTGSESLALSKSQATLPLNSLCGCLTLFHTVCEIK